MDAAPPLMPQPQSLKPHWLSWLFSSTILLVLPFFAGKALDFVLILGAIMLVQMIASIYLARGISARRQWGIGGIIGLSIVFMMGNFAIEFAVFIPLQ